jgi:hypothetical protein
MNKPAMSNLNPKTNAEAELLQTVLESELSVDTPYPWNGATADQYFDQLEAATPELEISEAEANRFFSRLDALWNRAEVQAGAKAAPVNVASFAQLLASRCVSIPQGALQSIAQQANALVDSQLSALDQLVQCVQGVLPQWDVEDLQVIARPYAYAMRSQEPKLPENVEWESLSEVEQGRLAMAIANWIMAELEHRKN